MKKWMAAVLAAAMMASMCGCGGTDGDTSQTESAGSAAGESTAVSVVSSASAAEESIADFSVDSVDDLFSNVSTDYSVLLPVYACLSWDYDGDPGEEKTDIVIDEKGHIVSYRQLFGTMTNTYDEDGLLIEHTESDCIQINKYNAKHQMIESTRTYDGGEGGSNISTYTYYDNGLLQEKAGTSRDWSDYKDTYSYEMDENGRVVSCTKVEEDGSKYIWEFSYDTYGLITSCHRCEYNGSGVEKLNRSDPTEFDALGHMIVADGFDVRYTVADYYAQSCAEIDSLKLPKDWVPIIEDVCVPTPDSVSTLFCEGTWDQANDIYTYQINSEPNDPLVIYNCYKSMDVQAQSIHPEVIEAFSTYKSILKDVLGYSVTDISDTSYNVKTKDYKFNVSLQYDAGNYFVEIAFSSEAGVQATEGELQLANSGHTSEINGAGWEYLPDGVIADNENADSKYVVLLIDYTNFSDTPRTMAKGYSFKAFQNGVQLEEYHGAYYGDVYSPMDDYTKEVMMGGTLRVGVCFLLEDDSPVTINAYDKSNYDNKQTVVINP